MSTDEGTATEFVRILRKQHFIRPLMLGDHDGVASYSDDKDEGASATRLVSVVLRLAAAGAALEDAALAEEPR